MKNSRRSDRDLARVIGVSQPTVSRMIARLQKEGVIREYTMMPDYGKLGFQIMSIIFMKTKERTTAEELEQGRKIMREGKKKEPSPSILTMNGMGCEADRVNVAFHESYSAYTEYVRMIRENPLVNAGEIRSFIIDLSEKNHYRPLTSSNLANYILRMNETRKK
jgi:DNA-binding Lrp family transcriptional regulator